jgi:hypothetical protein
MPIEVPEDKPVRHPEYVYMDYARHLSGRLRRTITGPMWHGPALREALEGITVAAAWENSQMHMANAYRSMAVRVCEVMSSGFLKLVEQQAYNIATMADGVVEHGAYHAGQIVLLRNEITSRRRHRATITDLMW